MTAPKPIDRCIVARKVRFRSKAKAEQAMVRMVKGPTITAPTRAYPCEHCGGWHLTSMGLA